MIRTVGKPPTEVITSPAPDTAEADTRREEALKAARRQYTQRVPRHYPATAKTYTLDTLSYWQRVAVVVLGLILALAGHITMSTYGAANVPVVSALTVLTLMCLTYLLAKKYLS